MQTDKDKLKSLLLEFGVGVEESPNTLTLEAGSGPKVQGYIGFVAAFQFDSTGAFVNVGIWE